MPAPEGKYQMVDILKGKQKKHNSKHINCWLTPCQTKSFWFCLYDEVVKATLWDLNALFYLFIKESGWEKFMEMNLKDRIILIHNVISRI